MALFAASKAHDPALASLFASSSGPVKAPEKPTRTFSEPESRPEAPTEDSSNSDVESESSQGGVSIAESSEDEEIDADRPRKRRRRNEDDIEGAYFQRLAKEEEREQAQQAQPKKPIKAVTEEDTSSEGSTESAADRADDEAIPVHESLQNGEVDADKTQRTVFLSNVSVTAIKSSASKKTLLDHLTSAIENSKDSKAAKIDSIRFRSTAYVAGSGPKKATYAKKELMEKTTHSTNAYVVFSSEGAAKTVARKLNGTVVLDRHLRIDNVANPAAMDHRRCVFVGNLPFVDEETAEDKDENGQPKRRAKAKVPADAEEGLWRTFGKAGKVENVRVVRDKETRVGKGFAYVQFVDANAVEAAILLDGKKFPPMLPRNLRVSRAKKVRSASRKDEPQKGKSRFERSKPSRPEGAVGRARTGRPIDGVKSGPSKVLFEGHRASSQSQKFSVGKKRKSKPTGRSAKRGASFKASGGSKKSDRK